MPVLPLNDNNVIPTKEKQRQGLEKGFRLGVV